MAAKNQPTKRRSWGRSREREKVVFVDQMEIDLLTRGETANEVRETPRSRTVELQHPELMKNHQLVAILKEMRVPLPVPSNGEPSRGDLLCLFKKHIVPRPQRTCLTGKRRMRLDQAGSSDSNAWEDTMEWSAVGPGGGGYEEWTVDSQECDRKRYRNEPSNTTPYQADLIPRSTGSSQMRPLLRLQREP